ncbi:MAG: hypothetical protein IT288_13775 [Bdellovibrionales bacterium]|nr:hypothetical protein [Bdellovibrionales bacterium]
MNRELEKNPRLAWMYGQDIVPYVFVRQENRIQQPGTAFALDWFQGLNHLWLNPLNMSSRSFGDQIMKMETMAFGPSGMPMPRWVFYDCAVMPGFVAGFAHRTETLPEAVKKILTVDSANEWTPISLFIIIPSMGEGEWVAHNLSSVNALIPKEHQFYGLGFLTKAFGMWHANIESCCGMTQWQSPAVRLHSHYGPFEILTSYTPLHSYARTLTYRLKTNTEYWREFFGLARVEQDFTQYFKPAGFEVDTKQDASLQDLQNRIERGEGPFYLSATEVRKKPLDAALTIYLPR